MKDPGKLITRLRCPDCSGSFRIIDFEQSQSPLQCVGCSRLVEFDRGVAMALPKTLASGALSNLEYYDALSSKSGNDLMVRTYGRNHRRKIRAVVNALGLDESPGGLAVLELGPGYGAHANEVLTRNHLYAGIDISAGLLRQAMQFYPSLKSGLLVAGDATAIPFDDEVFDRAFYVGSLHHIPDPRRGIHDMLRVMKQGGRFCIVEPRRYYPTHFVSCLVKYKTEISALKMKVRDIHKWLNESGARKLQISAIVFTPNRPAMLMAMFDRLDKYCEEHKSLHPLSVMFCVQGSK